MTRNIFIFSFVLGLMALSTNAVAQDSVKSTSETSVAKVTADDKADDTARESSRADKASAEASISGCAGKAKAGKKSCCASKASRSASADATMISEKDGSTKKSCCADGKKKDCKDKGAKAEAPAKDI